VAVIVAVDAGDEGNREFVTEMLFEDFSLADNTGKRWSTA
jgi:hypothetical protein